MYAYMKHAFALVADPRIHVKLHQFYSFLAESLVMRLKNKNPFLKKECLGQLRFEKWCSEFL